MPIYSFQQQTKKSSGHFHLWLSRSSLFSAMAISKYKNKTVKLIKMWTNNEDNFQTYSIEKVS